MLAVLLIRAHSCNYELHETRHPFLYIVLPPFPFPVAVGENFSPLFRELMVVTSSLFSLDDDLVRSRVHKMLQLLGVKNLHPADIIQHHILPVFTSGKWKV